MTHRASFEDRPLGVLATGVPGAAGMFRRCGIAFCRDGERTLAEAAATARIPLPAMLGALEDLAESACRDAPTATEPLIAHIVTRYHARHRTDLPPLIALAGTVERNHCDHPEAPRGLAELLEGLRSSLEDHMRKEELRVFPMMRQGRSVHLAAALEILRDEHEDTLQFLIGLERATRGYRAPATGAEDWRRLYGDLEQLVDDVVAHVHIEDSVLFPRFAAAAA